MPLWFNNSGKACRSIKGPKQGEPHPLLSVTKQVALIRYSTSHSLYLMHPMASSSRSYQTLKNSNNTEEYNFVEEEKVSKLGQEEEDEDWLKLGLGLGSGTSCKKIAGHVPNPVLVSPSLLSPSSQTLTSPQIGPGLGFERGSGSGPKKGNKGLGGVVEMETSDYSNSLLGWPSDHCYNDQYYHHHDDNGTVLWPSSCQIDPREDLPMPIPCDSHHYCSGNHHQSGLWFTLRSSTNRSGEALPQIPKAYIRVKDENMTVCVVKKYLVRKLGLSNEAEIDISCMGQSLSHIQTLKQVRDTIWLPRLVESVNSTTLTLGDSHDMSMNHLMSLLYRKHCILNCDL